MPLPAPPPGTVAARLLCALTARGVPAHRASERAGLARATVRWILTHPESFTDDGGRRRSTNSPTVATVAALARALGVDAAWLAFGDPYPGPGEAAGEPAGALPGQPSADPPEALPAPAAARRRPPAGQRRREGGEEHRDEVEALGRRVEALAELVARLATGPGQVPREVAPEEQRGEVEARAGSGATTRLPRQVLDAPAAAPAAGHPGPEADPSPAVPDDRAGELAPVPGLEGDPDEVLRRRFIASKVSQGRAAAAAGLSQSTLSRWLRREHRGAPDTLRRVGAFLDAHDRREAPAAGDAPAVDFAGIRAQLLQRLGAGTSRRAIAAAVGVDRSTITGWCAGHSGVTAETARKVDAWLRATGG